MNNNEANGCVVDDRSPARWAFDVTPGRERHVAEHMAELGCTNVERPTKGYVIAACPPTAVPVIRGLSGVVRALPLLDTDLFDESFGGMPPPVKISDVVQVGTGPYAHMNGIVRALDGEDLLVDVSLMGRIVRVRTKVTHVSVLPLPEPWR